MPTKPKVTIVTLCFNKFELTNRLLTGLQKHESENIDALIVVDNHSTDGTQAGLQQWRLQWGGVGFEIFTEKKNVGFTIGANDGLGLANTMSGDGNDIIFLISNDVQINGKFVVQAADILSATQNYLVGQKLLSNDTGWNTFDGRVFPYLEGFFLAATARGWRELGFFDSNYAPFDYEDVDLSTNAKKRGYKLTPLNNPAIIHEGAGTLGYTPEREAITRRNQEYFRGKWVK
jgi:GT2 family glycosyltransferase